MHIPILTTIILLTFIVDISTQSLLNDIKNSSRNEKRLSRKRRYLTFPSGSSLQLVYCLTMPSVGMGKIFTFGSTAALAWELPTEAEKLLETFGKRRTTTTTTTTTSAPIKLIHDEHIFSDYPSEKIDSFYGDSKNRVDGFNRPIQSYYDPFNLNKISKNDYTPIWYRGAVQNSLDSTKSKLYLRNNRFYDNTPIDIEPYSTYVHPVYHEIHRRTRRDLYKKIENLFEALNRDGRACLLKSICEVSKVAARKGSFMEEILKAIFRIKPHENYPSEDHYDEAADKSSDCDTEYPSCQHSLWTNMF